MNWLDGIMLIAAACGLAIGYRRGLVGQLMSVAGLVVAYISATLYYREAAAWIGRWIDWPAFGENAAYDFIVKNVPIETYLNNAVAFVLVFIGVKLACSAVGALLHIAVRAPGLSLINKWGGALLGFAAATILIAVAVHIAGAIPSEPLQRLLDESSIASIIRDMPLGILPPGGSSPSAVG